MRRGIFRYLLFMARGPDMPTLARDNTVTFGLCTPHNISSAGEAVAPVTLSSTSSRGGRGGDAHKSKQFLLYFAGSELSCHLHHINVDREEVMEGLIALLWDRTNGRVSRMYLARIFIALGGDAGGGGGVLRVRVVGVYE